MSLVLGVYSFWGVCMDRFGGDHMGMGLVNQTDNFVVVGSGYAQGFEWVCDL